MLTLTADVKCCANAVAGYCVQVAVMNSCETIAACVTVCTPQASCCSPTQALATGSQFLPVQSHLCQSPSATQDAHSVVHPLSARDSSASTAISYLSVPTPQLLQQGAMQNSIKRHSVEFARA